MPSFFDGLLEIQRAAGLPYVPGDTLSELAFAPFNPEVMSKTDVWAGILGTSALGIGLTALLGDLGGARRHVGEDANLFGRRFDPKIGYPLAGLVGAATMTHVAIAEELAFRGYLQSDMTRRWGPTRGWWGSSLVFGLVHAPNVLFIDPAQRAEYLTVSLPFITLTGSYLGLLYQWEGYSLAPPVAHHFWHNMLVSVAAFMVDPEHSPLSARVTIPF